MKIILIKDVESLGQKDDIREVKPGYFRNYLQPQGLAMMATPQAIAKAEKVASERQKEEAKTRKIAEQNAEKLQGQKITIKAKVGKDKKLFGSITAAKVIEAIEKQTKIKANKDALRDFKPIKTAEETKLNLKLAKDITADVIIDIVG